MNFNPLENKLEISVSFIDNKTNCICNTIVQGNIIIVDNEYAFEEMKQILIDSWIEKILNHKNFTIIIK